MNSKTLKRLQDNPHYKVSAKQLMSVEDEEKEFETPIIFGKPPVHPTSLGSKQRPLTQNSKKRV